MFEASAVVIYTRWNLDATEPKETSVDNGVQVSARFIVQDAENARKYTSECAKRLQSVTPLECVQKHCGSTRLNFLEMHRRLKPADNLLMSLSWEGWSF